MEKYSKAVREMCSQFNQIEVYPLENGGWSALDSFDVVFKECERYWYVSVNDLID